MLHWLRLSLCVILDFWFCFVSSCLAFFLFCLVSSISEPQTRRRLYWNSRHTGQPEQFQHFKPDGSRNLFKPNGSGVLVHASLSQTGQGFWYRVSTPPHRKNFGKLHGQISLAKSCPRGCHSNIFWKFAVWGT